MSVATIVSVVAVMVLGYRLGRTHAAWRDLRDAKRALTATRRIAWRHVFALAMGTAALLATIAAAGYGMAHQ